MRNIKDWIESKLFWLKTGKHLEIANNGNPVEPLVIRCNDLFFVIFIDSKSSKPTGDFFWSETPPLETSSAREFLTVCPATKSREIYEDEDDD